jgi:hypothetical protein
MLLSAAAIAGCGGGSSQSGGTAADPAGVTPADAPLYLGATVRPSGAQATATLAAGSSLTHQADPYLRLLAALRTPGSPALDYKSEVAPWLGPQAGFFLRSLNGAESLLALIEGSLTSSSASGTISFGGGHLDGAIVLDTTSASAARTFLTKQARAAGAKPTSYGGVSYEATPAGPAFALVGRFAVIGSEAALHEVIDTSRGAGSGPLATSSGYAKLAAAAPRGALAHLYVNPASVSAPAAPSGATGLLGALTGGREADISLVPSARSLTLDIDTPASATEPAGLFSPDPEAARTLDGLPGESWLALGLGHLSTKLQGDVAALKLLSSLLGSEARASSLGTLLEGLLAPVEIMGAPSAGARSEFGSWQRSAGIFASGAGLLELKGAIVIDSTDAARSKAAVARLGVQLTRRGDSISNTSIPGTEAAISARLRDFPLALDIAAGRGSDGTPKFVLGLGPASVGAALDPPSTLLSSATGAAAAKSLGGTPPSVIVQFPTLIGLLEGIGLAESPPVSSYLPLLRSLSTLAGGGSEPGEGIDRFELALGLGESPASAETSG